MNTAPTPRRVEWTGPEGYTVWTDEDGTHLRAPGGHSLEQPDVERLFSLWSNARATAESGHIPAPKPPSRDEMRAQGALRAEEYAKRRAIRAVEAEFNPPATAPF